MTLPECIAANPPRTLTLRVVHAGAVEATPANADRPLLASESTVASDSGDDEGWPDLLTIHRSSGEPTIHKRKHFNVKKKKMVYECMCGGVLYIAKDHLDDTRALSNRRTDHEKSKQHKVRLTCHTQPHTYLLTLYRLSHRIG